MPDQNNTSLLNYEGEYYTPEVNTVAAELAMSLYIICHNSMFFSVMLTAMA